MEPSSSGEEGGVLSFSTTSSHSAVGEVEVVAGCIMLWLAVAVERWRMPRRGGSCCY